MQKLDTVHVLISFKSWWRLLEPDASTSTVVSRHVNSSSSAVNDGYLAQVQSSALTLQLLYNVHEEERDSLAMIEAALLEA